MKELASHADGLGPSAASALRALPSFGTASTSTIDPPVVLIVDDIEDCRDVYGQFLRHAGYRVEEATDGHEALLKASTLGPDVIVMDLWMPRLDGWETIRSLKALPVTAGIPILVLTGDAYEKARRDAEAAGCEAYLVKPCLPTEVAGQVVRLLADARRRAADERASAPTVLSADEAEPPSRGTNVGPDAPARIRRPPRRSPHHRERHGV
jgi:CheY-like chemotaxis protein